VKLFQLNIFKLRVITLFLAFALMYAMYVGGSMAQWATAFGLYFVYGCVGIAVTFHRYLSHGSFKMSKWQERVFSFAGHLAGTGSAIDWVNKHHAHHRFSDTDRDPHSPRNGIWNMLTLGYKTAPRPRGKAVMRLVADPYYRWLHNNYLLLHMMWVVCLFAAFGLSGVLFGHLVPVAFVVFASLLTNLLGHTWGEQRYDTKDDSRNNALAGLLAWGEGWHNNHHRFPGRPNFGEKWWELDVSAFVIRLIQQK
jgi:stearoyl-CoA desaturase (delta-9 desaturase)